MDQDDQSLHMHRRKDLYFYVPLVLMSNDALVMYMYIALDFFFFGVSRLDALLQYRMHAPVKKDVDEAVTAMKII